MWYGINGTLCLPPRKVAPPWVCSHILSHVTVLLSMRFYLCSTTLRSESVVICHPPVDSRSVVWEPGDCYVDSCSMVLAGPRPNRDNNPFANAMSLALPPCLQLPVVS